MDNEMEFDRLAEGGGKTFMTAKRKRLMVSLVGGTIRYRYLTGTVGRYRYLTMSPLQNNWMFLEVSVVDPVGSEIICRIRSFASSPTN